MYRCIERYLLGVHRFSIRAGNTPDVVPSRLLTFSSVLNLPDPESGMLGCRFKQAFGIPCPGCGLQRSLSALVQGEWRLSISLYPALLPFMMGLLSSLAYFVSRPISVSRPVAWKRVFSWGIVFFFLLAFLLVFYHWLRELLG